MKRRWWIESAVPDFVVHPGARWMWVRTSRDGTTAQVVGCVCHHTWTNVVRRFREVPNATR